MIDDRFPDAYGNEVVVRLEAGQESRIEVFCHAPSLYEPDVCTALYLDEAQRQRLIAALAAEKEDPS